jgi:type VI secretion system secreted protein Hcp
MRKSQGQRAFGRLGSFVVAGVVVSAVVAAIAFAASNSSSASQAGPPVVTGNPNAVVTQLQLGTGDAFPVSSFSWGISNPVTITGGGGGGSGKAIVSEMIFTKPTDATTVELLKAVATGSHYATAVVTSTLPSGTFEYRLTEVVVTNVSISSGGGGSVDSFSLNFGRVIFTHTDAAGHATGGSNGP